MTQGECKVLPFLKSIFDVALHSHVPPVTTVGAEATKGAGGAGSTGGAEDSGGGGGAGGGRGGALLGNNLHTGGVTDEGARGDAGGVPVRVEENDGVGGSVGMCVCACTHILHTHYCSYTFALQASSSPAFPRMPCVWYDCLFCWRMPRKYTRPCVSV